MIRAVSLALCASVVWTGCLGLELVAVSPRVLPAGVAGEIEVEGGGFHPETRFFLESPGVFVTLSPPSLGDERLARVTVPAAAPAGAYDLVARDVAGEARLPGALERVEGRARVIFLDVGQGDATLVISPEGQTLLIDGGPQSAAPDVEAALQHYANDRLDAVVLSHFDADHLGGLVALLSGPDRVPGTDDDRVPPTLLGPPDRGHCDTDTCARLRRLRAWPFSQARAGDRFALGSVDISVVAAGGDVGAGVLPDVHDDNEESVAVQASFGGRSVLVLADLTGGGLGTVDLETPLSERTGPVDILRVAHHGSATSSAPSAVARWQPRVAVLSVGTNNNYCHPASAVVSRLASSGARLFATGSGVIDTDARCLAPTPAPEAARFGVGDVRVDIDAAGTLWLNDEHAADL